MHIFVNAPIWSAISIASAVLCANLPMLKPLLTRSILPLRLRSWIHTLTASTNKHSSDPSEPAGSKPKRGRNYNEISDEGLPPTIGGTRERRGAFKGGRDLYPLETFNETVVEGEKEGGGSGDGGECGGRA
ncbi:hypothetical protein BDV95DRAFT_54126 [Massariosphaeria phaeospora]|uniref:Uncharacterized protein n=1 Tax=Massariosphaeria phaeospora TaxID=100035 RepID=A0A7C8MJV5_9PLEO|nr:hypothetical protein BDV95DRAFT_54126 [Massariosphaeria phaeospora]